MAKKNIATMLRGVYPRPNHFYTLYALVCFLLLVAIHLGIGHQLLTIAGRNAVWPIGAVYKEFKVTTQQHFVIGLCLS